MTLKAHIAVTGLSASENPQPGPAVLRSLREVSRREGRLLGLVYDALESGIYTPGLADDVFLIPYPSEGSSAFLSRLDYILSQRRIDVILPTLDAEILQFVQLQPELERRGIHTFLPDRRQFQNRSKVELAKLAEEVGIPHPHTVPVTDPARLLKLPEPLTYPLLVKGVFYGASVCRTAQEARIAYGRIEAEWGLPVLLQQHLAGDEYVVVALGDGTGRTLGAVPMRKVTLSKQGKAWGGVTLANDEILAIVARLIEALRWRGPLELDLIRCHRDDRYYLIEINPRFPAWMYLATAAGQNMAEALVRLALGETVEELPQYQVGKYFVRSALDHVFDLRSYAMMSAQGELLGALDEGGES